MERYRSGHNEAVSKTVCPQGRMGSNPILSAWHRFSCVAYNLIFYIKFNFHGEVLKRLKRHPWKGCRSLIAARGFKSLLLRLVFSKNTGRSYLVFWPRTLITKQHMQPWKSLKRSFRSVRQHTKIKQPKNSKRDRLAKLNLEGWILFFESSILAQDERWRRA